MKLNSLHCVKVLISNFGECLSKYSFPQGDLLLQLRVWRVPRLTLEGLTEVSHPKGDTAFSTIV